MELAANHPTESEQAQGVWSACLDLVRESVNSQSFKTWFEPIIPLNLESGKLTIQVPSQFFYDWLEEHYNTLINSTITRVLGKDAMLEYSIGSEEHPLELEYQPSAERPGPFVPGAALAPGEPRSAFQRQRRGLGRTLAPRRGATRPSCPPAPKIHIFI